MAEFKEGQSVWVKVQDVQPGPFDERLVVISTGPINLSGFVNKKFVEERGSASFINGRVIGVTPEAVNLQLPVSFFTTASGMASVPREWASQNVETAEAA